MKSLFEYSTYNEVLERLENLSSESDAHWGKMNLSQMLAHCQKPLQVALQKITLKKPNPFIKFLFSFFKKSLYDDKPWKKGLPTAKEFVIKNERGFHQEKAELKNLIDEFYASRNKTDWPTHPFFGHFAPEEWGKMQYKHLDHHFRQFGA